MDREKGQTGAFPSAGVNGNDKYRDAVTFGGKPRTGGDLASRLVGSSDLYESSKRTPHCERELRHVP